LLREVAINGELVAQVSEGVLPAYWHQYLKALIGLGYMAAQWRLIIRHRKLVAPRSLMNWLFILTGLLTFIGLMLLISVALHNYFIDTQAIITIGFAALFLPLLFLLFLRPNVLYGLKPGQGHIGRAPKQQSSAPLPTKALLNDEECTDYVARIERHFRDRQPFLRNRYALTDLAREIDVPRHVLSACINQYYQTNFNEVINRFRIEYLLQEVAIHQWEELSIEGIGREVGFNSRTTFLKAFKKNVGMNPSEYRAQLMRGYK